MCCCRPRILWPDPALSCAALRRTRVVPGPSSASRREAGSSPRAGSERSFGPARTHPGACRCGEGRPALPPASRRGSALQEPPGALLLAFRGRFCPPGLFPALRSGTSAKKAKEARPARAERAGGSPGRAAALSGAGLREVLPPQAIALPGCADAGASLSFPLFHPPSILQKIIGA